MYGLAKRLARTVLVALFGLGLGAAQAAGTGSLTTDEARQIAIDAYIYGYSLITTDVTRVQLSNVTKLVKPKAPTGTFSNINRYPPTTFSSVSAPNAETL